MIFPGYGELHVQKILTFIEFALLQLLDQELNMTRRTTRPFVPTATGTEFGQLERQRNILEEPLPTLPM